MFNTYLIYFNRNIFDNYFNINYQIDVTALN